MRVGVLLLMKEVNDEINMVDLYVMRGSSGNCADGIAKEIYPHTFPFNDIKRSGFNEVDL
jgi:hypothetical protein